LQNLQSKLFYCLQDCKGNHNKKLIVNNDNLNDTNSKFIFPILLTNNMLELHLCNNNLTQKNFELLSKYLIVITSLTSISIKKNNVNDAGIIQFSVSIYNLKHLLNLDLSFNRITAKGFKNLFENLKFNEKLLSLNIKGNQLADKGLVSLAKDYLSYNYGLKALYIKWNKLGEAGLNELAHTFYTLTSTSRCSIIIIDLSGNKLQASGVKVFFNSLNNNKYLQNLNLSKNLINDDIKDSVSLLIKVNQALVNVDFSSNSFTHITGIEIADALKYNKSILDVNINNNYYSQGEFELIKAFSECKEFNQKLNRVYVFSRNILINLYNQSENFIQDSSSEFSPEEADEEEEKEELSSNRSKEANLFGF